MRVNRSTGYALLAVGYIAKNADKKIIVSQDISKHYDIAPEYLLKMLHELVRANVLRGKRGPRGGFSLAKPAAKITMLEIIEAIEGPMTGQLHLAEQAGTEKFSARAEQVYERAVARAREVLARTKLSSLIESK